MVDEEGCRVARIGEHRVPATKAGKVVPAGTVAVVRSSDFLRAFEQSDRAFNSDPPTSSYAIMRRARLYRGENNGPGKDDREELDTHTRN